MHLNVHSKPFDAGVNLYPMYSPTSSTSSLSSTLYGSNTNISRSVKVASDSLAHDLCQRSLHFLSPDPVDPRKHAMQEDEVSSPDEDSDLSHSTRRSAEYLVLAAKDRLRSASLEWTLSNGSVTPKMPPHYHTHPPLDFKSLKKKLEELTGSPDDANKKPFPGITGHERRKGVVISLPATTADTKPAGGNPPLDAVKQSDHEVERRAAGANFFQKIPCVSINRLSRTTSEGVDAEPIKLTEAQSASERERESSVKFQWSEVTQHLAQKDERLKKILQRHCQELENLRKKHQTQWTELRLAISDSSVAKDVPQKYVPQQSEQPCRSFHEVTPVTHVAGTDPEAKFKVHADGQGDRRELALHTEPFGKSYANQEGIDHRSLLGQGCVDPMFCSPSVSHVKHTVGHSLGNGAVAAQSYVRRIEEVDGESRGKDLYRYVDGARNLSGVYGAGNLMKIGVPQLSSAQVRSQPATPSTTTVQHQLEHQASRPTKAHSWRNLLERTQLQNPPVQQVESYDWHQMLEIFQRFQAEASLGQWINQALLWQTSLLQAIAEAQTRAAKFSSCLLANRLCQCARLCDLSQSILPHFHEQPYSGDPYSVLSLTGHAGIGYVPNCAQVPLFPQPSVIPQSPCSEVSSYYLPENLGYSSSTRSSPDQLACLLEAARNNLLSVSPALLMPLPPPLPLLSHLVARQSPIPLDLAYPSSLRASPALPTLSSWPLFQF